MDSTLFFEAQKNKKKDLIQLFRLHNKDLADTLSSECETFKVLRAGSRGEKETLESLHKDGFDMEVRDYDGRTALHLASMNGHKDAVNFLINSCKVTTNIPDRNGRTPYEEAKEQYEAIKNNNKDNNYFSILRLFEEQMSVKVIDQSKSVEVMINDQSKDVEPIYVINKAVAKGNLAKLKSLGLVYMDAVDYLKETPLHIAAAKGQLEVVKYLVEEKKVSLFVRNSFWQTPIHLARKKCKYWQKKITRNPSEKPASKWDDYGRDFQSDSDSEDGKKEEKTTDKDIHDRIKLFKEVSEYLRRKMRDQVDDDENVDTSLSKYREDELTFLFLNSTFRGDIAAVKRYLATKGHNLVNEPDYSQRTALHIAVSEGHYHLVIYFLKNWKANTDCKDRWGHKPIDDAKRNKDEKMIEIIEKYSN